MIGLTLVILISQEVLMLIMVIHDDIALLTQIHFVIIIIISAGWAATKDGRSVKKVLLIRYDEVSELGSTTRILYFHRLAQPSD